MTIKIAVIGDREFILPFKALGLDIFPTEKREEAKNIVLGLELERYGIIFITEDLAPGLEEILAEIREKPFPTILPIPSSLGSTGIALGEMGNFLKKALGWDFLSAE